MTPIYRRSIETYETPHVIYKRRGAMLAHFYIKSIVSVDNGNTWWYLGENSDYPCSSYQHARDMLDHFVGQDEDPETQYIMNPVIWAMLPKEKVEVKKMSELYIELQKRFIRNFNGDMETARNAFEAYWDTLETCAKEIYGFLCEKYNGSKENHSQCIVRQEVVEEYVKRYFYVPLQFAKEVVQVLILPRTDYHSYITETQGGGIVI